VTEKTQSDTVRRVLPLAAEWLGKRGVDAPRLDAELLLAHVLKLKRLDLYLDHDRPLAEAELGPFRALMKRRAAREPIAYILGEREFYGLAFEVTRDVLVPRPDTEHLVLLAKAELEKRPDATFADVGTGSGCIAIALLHESKTARGVAIDLSAAALAVARRNAGKHGVLERLELLEGDLLAPLAGRKVGLVVSNPPYVLPGERPMLAPELGFEPERALFDADGLPLTKRLAVEARAALEPGGLVAIETGAGSAGLVRGHLEAAGFLSIETTKDLGGHERIVSGRAP
jgi:release factor glutamine methyltransferase